MAVYIIPKRLLMRGDTAAVLASRNEILLERELCFETDTGLGKIGDGSTPWNDLEYINGGTASSGTDSQTPTLIASGETFTVAANKQVLFSEPIELDGTAVLDVEGLLIEVD